MAFTSDLRRFPMAGKEIVSTTVNAINHTVGGVCLTILGVVSPAVAVVQKKTVGSRRQVKNNCHRVDDE